MLKIITSDTLLRKYFPNAIISVTGETPLFDKVSPFLELAEEWVKMTFTSDATFDAISGYADGSVIKVYTAKVVVAHAMMNAVPSLDVVLTPNGFGVVSNRTSPLPRKSVSKGSLPRSKRNATVRSAFCSRLCLPFLAGLTPHNVRTSLPRCSQTSTSAISSVFGNISGQSTRNCVLLLLKLNST